MLSTPRLAVLAFGRFGQICLATSWKLAVSVQHGQVGKFKVLDLLDSAVLERMVRLAGAADLQHLAVARSVLQPRPAVGSLCRLV